MHSNEKYLFIFYRFAHVHPINCEIRVLHITAAGVGEWVRQDHSLTEKELPQEQPWSACGFLSTWKVERISSWLKSTVDPFTNSRLSWSTITPTPPFSNTLKSQQCTADKKPIRKQQQGTCITRLCNKEIWIRGCLPVVLVLLSVNRKLVLKPGAASSLHIYSQVLALFRDLP